jgi:hypothetical protein
MNKLEKKEWALANIGGGDEDVQYYAEDVGGMTGLQLNDVYTNVILARRHRLANPY